MDLRVYYTKIREAMAALPGEFVVLVSRETPDGGKPGIPAEASKLVAARMIVEGRARLATQDETCEYYQREEELRAKAAQDAAPARLQVAVLSEKDIEALKSARPVQPPIKSK
jgi:hypothetical protein